MRFNKDGYYNFILDNKIIGFFDKEVTLASGRKSRWYVNWRKVSNDVFLIDELTDYVLNFAMSHGMHPDCFYGVPEGATKLGLITQYKWATRHSEDFDKGSNVFPMGRGRPKDHGDPKDKYFIGEPIGKVIMLEDVTTTGSSLIKAINSVLELKTNKIIKAISLTDRMEITDQIDSPVYIPKGISVKDALSSMNISYESMGKATEILPLAYERFKPGKEIAKAIEEEFDRYGVEKLKLL